MEMQDWKRYGNLKNKTLGGNRLKNINPIPIMKSRFPPILHSCSFQDFKDY